MEEQRYKYENKKICLMMIDLLMEGGADINIRVDNTTGYTILMKLVSVENMDYEKFENTAEIIKFLIERGADPYIKGNDSLSVYDLIKHSYYQSDLTNILNYGKQTVFFSSNMLSINLKKPDADYEVLLYREKKKSSCCDVFYNY
jgi:ankyrin repeat protein